LKMFSLSTMMDATWMRSSTVRYLNVDEAMTIVCASKAFRTRFTTPFGKVRLAHLFLDCFEHDATSCLVKVDSLTLESVEISGSSSDLAGPLSCISGLLATNMCTWASLAIQEQPSDDEDDYLEEVRDLKLDSVKEALKAVFLALGSNPMLHLRKVVLSLESNLGQDTLSALLDECTKSWSLRNLVLQLPPRDVGIAIARLQMRGWHHEQWHDGVAAFSRPDPSNAPFTHARRSDAYMQTTAMTPGAWSREIVFSTNYFQTVVGVLGRQPVPEDQVLTASGDRTTFAEFVKLQGEDLQAAFPVKLCHAMLPQRVVHNTQLEGTQLAFAAPEASEPEREPPRTFSTTSLHMMQRASDLAGRLRDVGTAAAVRGGSDHKHQTALLELFDDVAERLRAASVLVGRMGGPLERPSSKAAIQDTEPTSTGKIALHQVQDAVIVPIDHDEPAREPDASDSLLADALWADSVQHLNEHLHQSKPGDDVSCADVPEGESIYLLEYSRDPKEFYTALETSCLLRPIRQGLVEAGRSFKLASGPWIFVYPYQYDDVMESLRSHNAQLFPRHVLVAESIMWALQASFEDIPSKKGVRRKSQTVFLSGGMTSKVSEIHQAAKIDFEIEEIPLCVQRTFFCVARPERNANSVICSTTDAHEGVNPRRVIASWE